MIEKIKEISDKYPWLLMVVPIIVVAIVAFFFLSGKNNFLHPGVSTSPTVQSPNSPSSTTQSSNASNASTTQGSNFNLLSFVLRLFGGNSSSQTQNSTSSSTGGSQSQQSGTSSTESNISGSPTSPTASAANSSQNTSGGSQNSSNSSGSNDSTPIQIIFKTPDGGTETYTPPATPPVDLTWARYVNATDRYAVDYPSNWQIVKTEYNGHEGVSLYAPGTDLNGANAQYIGFGLANYYLLPAGDTEQNTYSYPVTISGINGRMYTQGVLGTGSVALVAQTGQGYFGMGSNISDSTFIYVYNHMLQSLTFGPQ